jgi:predicted nucleic acid-binding protein
MKFVLDTNVVSALMKGDTQVVERLKRSERAEIGIPQPVIAEIAYGIERLSQSKRKEALARRFDLLKEEIQRVECSPRSRLPWSGEGSASKTSTLQSQPMPSPKAQCWSPPTSST